jgi:hypothetical protein
MNEWKYCYWIFLISYAFSAPQNHVQRSPTIDYQRYSRQILVYGEESQDIFNNSTVLMSGSGSPLMIEIVKNLALSGVGKIIFVNATIIPPPLLRHYVASLNSQTLVTPSPLSIPLSLPLNPHRLHSSLISLKEAFLHLTSPLSLSPSMIRQMHSFASPHFVTRITSPACLVLLINTVAT